MSKNMLLFRGFDTRLEETPNQDTEEVVASLQQLLAMTHSDDMARPRQNCGKVDIIQDADLRQKPSLHQHDGEIHILSDMRF